MSYNYARPVNPLALAPGLTAHWDNRTYWTADGRQRDAAGNLVIHQGRHAIRLGEQALRALAVDLAEAIASIDNALNTESHASAAYRAPAA